MRSLEESRKRIDEIDKELVRLFEERMNTVVDVAKYKKENNIDVLNKNREAEVVEKAINNLKDKKYAEEVADFFNHLMDISKNFQRKAIAKKMVSNLKKSIFIDITETASKAGYSMMINPLAKKVCEIYFGDKTKKIEFNSYDDIMSGLIDESLDYVLLAVDNAMDGHIAELYDLLEKYEDIYIKDKFVTDKDGIKLEDIHGLNTENYNKFIILGKYKRFVKDSNKIDLIVRIDNEPKSLGHLVKYFSNYNININKIDSREADSSVKDFSVFINFDGSLEDKNIFKMLSGLEGDVHYLRLVGAYRG